MCMFMCVCVEVGDLMKIEVRPVEKMKGMEAGRGKGMKLIK